MQREAEAGYGAPGLAGGRARRGTEGSNAGSAAQQLSPQDRNPDPNPKPLSPHAEAGLRELICVWIQGEAVLRELICVWMCGCRRRRCCGS